MLLHLLYWLALAAVFATGQGLLLPAIRLTPPGPEARRQSFALHVLFTLVYFAPLAWHPTLPDAAAACAARLLMFDPVLNIASGQPLLYVGSTAAGDKLLRRLSAAHPERLALLVRLAATAAALWLGWRG